MQKGSASGPGDRFRVTQKLSSEVWAGGQQRRRHAGWGQCLALRVSSRMACSPEMSEALLEVSSHLPFKPSDWHQLLLMNPVQDVKAGTVSFGCNCCARAVTAENQPLGRFRASQDLTFSWVIPYQEGNWTHSTRAEILGSRLPSGAPSRWSTSPTCRAPTQRRIDGRCGRCGSGWATRARARQGAELRPTADPGPTPRLRR